VTTAEVLVNDWKMDREQSKRFDTNRDGYLSGRELMNMHRVARRVAEEKVPLAFARWQKIRHFHVIARTTCRALSVVPEHRSRDVFRRPDRLSGFLSQLHIWNLISGRPGIE
jgi:hypothetical protein